MDPIPMDAARSISESTTETPTQPPSVPDPTPPSTIPDPIIPPSVPSVQSTISQIPTLIEAAPSIPSPQQQQKQPNSQSQHLFPQHHGPQVPTPRAITTTTSTPTRPPPPFSNFHHNFSNSSPSTTAISSTPMPPPSTLPMSNSMQRSGIAIGVPAASSHPRSGPVPFSSFGPTPSFGQPFSGGIQHPSRGASSVSEKQLHPSSGSNAQTRPPSLQEIQGIHMRPSLVSSTLNQQRPPGQQPVRSISQGISMPSSIQKPSNQGTTRVPSVVSPTAGSAQSTQPLQQPWLVRPQHPSSFRPQVRPQVLQQRPAQQQQQQQQYQIPPKQLQQQQKQQQISLQAQQQLLAKNQQSMTQQQLLASRAASQKTQLSGAVPSGSSVPAVDVDDGDGDDSGNHMVRRRSIQELIAQVDPSEKLDPEVEEILLDIADDFIESAMTAACSLAKHRKSTTLESKDVLLHLERNWNMTLPGFGGEEMKGNKRPSANDLHKDRLATIKKSMTATPDAGNAKRGGGHSANG